MPLLASEPRSLYQPAPAGLQQAVCCDVIDLGENVNQFNGKMQRKCRIVWQSEHLNDALGLRYEISQMYTLSLHEKSGLRKHLQAWRGKAFSAEELAGFDLEKLIGANCQVQIEHKLGANGKTYANVTAIVPMGRTMTPMSVEGYERRKSVTDDAAGHTPDNDDAPLPL